MTGTTPDLTRSVHHLAICSSAVCQRQSSPLKSFSNAIPHEFPVTERKCGDETRSSPPVDSTTMDIVSWTTAMAALNMRMTEHLHRMPVVASAVDSRAVEEASVSHPAKDDGLDVENILHMSEQMTGLLAKTLARSPPAPKHMTYMSDGSSARLSPETLSLDPASELLLVSTYLRLIEIFDRLLHHIKFRTTRESEVGSILCRTVTIPGFSAGPFSPSSTAETQLQLTLSLIEFTFADVRDLAYKIISPKNTPGYRGAFNSYGGVALAIVPDMALSAVRVRETAVFAVLAEIKESLLYSDLV